MSHMRRRGKGTWELRAPNGRDPVTGKRRSRFVSFKGTRREAEVRLAQLVTNISQGCDVPPSKLTVAEHLRARVDQWEAAGDITARTAQRYRQLVECQIVPHIGDKIVQKLRPLDIEAWHTTLKNNGRQRGKGGVSAQTVLHAHRVLSKALDQAVKNDLAQRNVAKLEPPPRVGNEEMTILTGEDVSGIVAKLRGQPHFALAMLGLFTGMRLSEILALRWRNVDLDGAQTIYVKEALEETKAFGVRFKPPKTKAGKRDITLPDLVIETLREHKREQLKIRLQLGLGKLPEAALVFPNADGGPRSTSAVSREWGLLASAICIPHITFHSLRHSHASMLIDANVDPVTIARRLGHSNPTVTLMVYGHLFKKDDSKAAAAINTALTTPR